MTALCIEQSEEWLAGRVYLDMANLNPIDADDPTATSQHEEVTSMAA